MKTFANQKNEKNLRKSWNDSNFNNWKINITNINVGARTKSEWYHQECDEYGHNVRKTVTKKLILDFWKLEKLLFVTKNQEKRIHFIVQHSRRWKDNETKIHPLNKTQKKKKQSSNKQNMKTICRIKCSINFWDYIYEKKQLFFKKLKPKNDFYWNEIKVSHVAQKDYF